MTTLRSGRTLEGTAALPTNQEAAAAAPLSSQDGSARHPSRDAIYSRPTSPASRGSNRTVIPGRETPTTTVSQDTFAHLSERAFLDYYVDGLREDLRRGVRAMMPRTLREAEDHARNQESLSMETTHKKVRIDEVVTSTPDHTKLTEAINKLSAQLSAQAPPSQVPFTRNSPARRSGGKPDHKGKTCYHCGGQDHIARICPEKPPCTYCGKRGHNEDKCYKKIRDLQQQQAGSPHSATQGN